MNIELILKLIVNNMKKFTDQELLKESVEADELLKQATDIINQKEIILFNDPHNSFEFVKKALVVLVGHTLEQAEQCTLIAHNKNQCSIKKGTYEKLKPICHSLNMAKLTAEIH